MEVAGANRCWRWQFRCRGSRRESAVAQLFSLGIIHTLMKTIALLFALSLLLAGCSKHTSDAAIRRHIGGTWIANESSKHMLYPDGRLQLIRPEYTVDGTWSVADGVLTETLTHMSGTNTAGEVLDERLNQIWHYKVVSIDDHDLVCRISDQTNLWVAHKP